MCICALRQLKAKGIVSEPLQNKFINAKVVFSQTNKNPLILIDHEPQFKLNTFIISTLWGSQVKYVKLRAKPGFTQFC